MSTEVPDSKRLVLRRYLLGQLSPAEQDQVEEQFADPDYFAIYQSVERGLVQEYAGGSMAPLDADLFARNYLVTRTRRDQVVIAQALLEVRSDRWSVQPMHRASFPKWIPVLAMAASVVAAAVVVRHLRPARQVLTASAQPVKPPAVYTSAPPEQPPPLHETPRAPAKATPSSKAASSPTPEGVLPAAAEPTPAPPAESLPPIPVPEPPPSQPVGSSSRALTAPTGTTPYPQPRAPLGRIPAMGLMSNKKPRALGAPPPSVTLRHGTEILVRTIDLIDSNTADASREYAAVVVNGFTALPANTGAVLRATSVANPEPGRSSLTTSLVAVIVNGQRVEIKTSEVDSKSGTKARGSESGAAIGAAGGGGILKPGAGSGSGVRITPGTGFWYVVAELVEIPLRPLPPPADSVKLTMGMTIDEVVGLRGQPTTMYGDPSKKMIYIYTDLKLVFVDGKLTDIQ